VAADDGGITARHAAVEALRIDERYLREEAYRLPDRLDTRVALHRRFSTSETPWQRWVFDRLLSDRGGLRFGARVLEIGCGPGDLWAENLDRLDPSWRLTLVDLSEGMLDAACARLGGRMRYVVGDARRLPFEADSFDVVVANHVLYHVPDLPRALDELVRVLAPQGRLVATTIGAGHLAELRTLVGERAPWSRNHERFGLGTGSARLAPWFAEVRRVDYEDSFRVTEAEPLLDYLLSTTVARSLEPADVAELRAEIAGRIDRDGAFAIRKEVGLLDAVAR
jgi:ubiquinone/menaquinone biosynthesis C-methylase UbiE